MRCLFASVRVSIPFVSVHNSILIYHRNNKSSLRNSYIGPNGTKITHRLTVVCSWYNYIMSLEKKTSGGLTPPLQSKPRRSQQQYRYMDLAICHCCRICVDRRCTHTAEVSTYYNESEHFR